MNQTERIIRLVLAIISILAIKIILGYLIKPFLQFSTINLNTYMSIWAGTTFVSFFVAAIITKTKFIVPAILIITIYWLVNTIYLTNFIGNSLIDSLLNKTNLFILCISLFSSVSGSLAGHWCYQLISKRVPNAS
ncbi:MAG: hypothetical protein GY777_28085 [Candidatus Brocadiaceae bacterium]|nr:hypothetical protein [Candidatus Brocadiaceae bacterium]